MGLFAPSRQVGQEMLELIVSVTHCLIFKEIFRYEPPSLILKVQTLGLF